MKDSMTPSSVIGLFAHSTSQTLITFPTALFFVHDDAKSRTVAQPVISSAVPHLAINITLSA